MKPNRMKAKIARGEPALGCSVMFASPQIVEMLGHAGFDWVLIGATNIRDERRIFNFLNVRGSTPARLEANGVGYLRTEKGDLVQLCQHIIMGLYGVKATEEIDLVPEGFSWKS